MKINGEGLVLEPLKKKAQEQMRKQLQKQLRKLAGKNVVALKVNAYCLEFLREPPAAGMMFQIAGTELQQQFEPMRDILTASRYLQQAGGLVPDSDPTEYFHFIRQWAIWSEERDFDQKGFGKAFLERTKKNFKSAGRPWTKDLQKLIEGIVPHRWTDIQKVLEQAAAEPDPQPMGK